MEGNPSGNWFDDDPEWTELRRRLDKKTVPSVGQDIVSPKKSKPAQPKPQLKPQKPPTSTRQISLNITIPRVKIKKLSKAAVRRLGLPAAITAGVIIVAFVFTVISVTIGRDKSKSDGTHAVLSQNATKPDFKFILPDGKEEETDNGKIGYDPQKRVVSFADTIGIVKVTVSQQPLPDNFKQDPEGQLEILARNFSANEVIVPSNPKAYLGTSAKGPQTVIFSKSDLLVFIQAASKIDKIDWTDYIRNLR